MVVARLYQITAMHGEPCERVEQHEVLLCFRHRKMLDSGIDDCGRHILSEDQPHWHIKR